MEISFTNNENKNESLAFDFVRLVVRLRTYQLRQIVCIYLDLERNSGEDPVSCIVYLKNSKLNESKNLRITFHAEIDTLAMVKN